jgi:hypothetical protein
LVFLVCAVTAAGAHYLVQGLDGGTPDRAGFVITVLILPTLLQLAAQAMRVAMRRLHRARRARQK